MRHRPVRPLSFWTLFAAFIGMAALHWRAAADPPATASTPAGTCDPIDFNNDGIFPDTADIDAFRDVMAGASCPTCNDIDFNNDGIFPDQEDLQAFLRVFAGGPCVAPAPALGPSWRDYTPGPTDRQLYVSQSLGSDTNPGTIERPLRTPSRAFDGLRRTSGDGMFLKRGDVFEGWIGASDGGWNKGGLDAEHPLWCGAYGSGPRPVVYGVGGSSAVNFQSGGGVRFVALDGIELRARPGGGSPAKGINWYAEGGACLVQDCAVLGYLVNVNVEALGRGLDGLVVRGCVIADATPGTSGSHSNGMHLNNAHDPVIEWCLLDYNGKDSRGFGSVFNHNLYDACNTSGLVVRHCTSARASATGVQWRAQDGLVESVLSLDNPLGITTGHAEIRGKAPTATYWPDMWDAWACRGAVRGNLIVGGGDIAPGQPRGIQLGVGYPSGLDVTGNILLTPTGGDPVSINLGTLVGSGGVRISGNTVYSIRGKTWGDEDPTHPNAKPTDANTIREGAAAPFFDDYLASIGCASHGEYLQRARASWSRATWDARYTPDAAIAYVRSRVTAAGN